MAERVSFPTEEEGMPGIHLDIKHDLSSGGDPTFSGSFHGAGSGGAEAVDPHKTNLSRIPSMGIDAAAGVHHGPGHAGAHPLLYMGIDSSSGTGVGAGEGGAVTSSDIAAAPPASAQPARPAGEESQEPAPGVLQSAAQAVGGAVESIKELTGMRQD
ncbi:hypothetical protein ABPG77_007734 [Micractinium sp. CCAP 211/92]